MRMRINIIFVFILQTCFCKRASIKELQEQFKSILPKVEHKAGTSLSITKQMFGCIYVVKLEEVWKNIPVRFLQEVLFPDINLSQLSGHFLQTDQLKVGAYSLNVCDRRNPIYELSVNAASYDLASNHFAVNNLSMLVTFSAISNRVTGMINIVLSDGYAFYNFNGDPIYIQIGSEYGEKHVSCKCSFKNISFISILEIFQQEVIENIFLGKIQNSQDLDLKQLEFIDVDLEGYIIPLEGFEFQITGGPRGLEIFSHSSKTFVIVKQNEEQKIINFLLFSLIENFDFSHLISNFSNIKNLPYLQLIDGTLAILISDGCFSNFRNEAIKVVINNFLAGTDLQTVSNVGIHYFYRIKNLPNNESLDFKKEEGGLSFNKTYFPLNYVASLTPASYDRQTIDNGSNDNTSFFSDTTRLHNGSSFQPYRKYTIIKMIIDNKGLILKPVINISSSFIAVIKYIFGEEYTQDVEYVPLNEKKIVFLKSVMVYPFDESSTVVKVTLETSIDVLLNIVQINSIVFDVSRTFGSKEVWLIDINGSGMLQKIKLMKSEKKYFITGDVDVYSQTDLTKYVSHSYLFNNTMGRFEELVDFPYKNAFFKMELEKEQPKSITISARSIIFSQQDVPLETVIWQHDKLYCATVFRLNDISLDEVLNRLYDARMLKFTWLTLKNIEIVLRSNAGNVTGIFSSVFGDYVSPKSKSVVVVHGQLSVNLKTTCLDDPICNFIKNHIAHHLNIEITGNALKNSYSFKCLLKNVTKMFGDVWILNSIELNIFGTNEKDSRVQLIGKIVHKETKHVGEVFIGEDDLLGKTVLKITFDKQWKNFLGYSMLTINSMRASIYITDKPVETLDFYARIEIGNTNKSIFINKAVVTLSLKFKSSEDSDVVYAFLYGLTIDSLSNAFKNSKVHFLMQDTVFSDELVLAFTQNKKGTTVKELGNYKFYPTCTGIWGMNTFIGYVTACVDFSNGLKITFQPKSLSYFDEKLMFFKSSTNDIEGPEFSFEIMSNSNKNEKNSYVKGFLKTIGYQGYIHKSLNSDDLSFQFAGYLFKEVKMNVNLSALFGDNHIKYTATLDVQAAMPEISKNIKLLISNAHEKIQINILDKLNDLLSDITKLEQELKLKREYLLNRNSERRNNVFKRRLLIEEANEAIKTDCVDICGSKCVESLDWTSNCTAVAGQPLACLKWKKCNYLAADTKCIANCEALKIPTSISAHHERDEIRNLAEDISVTTSRMDGINSLLNRLIKLKFHLSYKFEEVQNKTLFLQILNTANQDLFKFTNEIPTSSQELANINIPELHFNSMSYLFLGKIYTMSERSFFINHHFFYDFAEELIQGADERFKTMTELIDHLKSEVAKQESLFFDFKEDYRNRDQKDSEFLEDNEEEGEEERRENKEDNEARISFDHEKFKYLFNPLLIDKNNKNMTKRSTTEDSPYDAVEKDGFLEIKIQPCITKGSKTVNAFKRHSSWIMMKSNNRFNIPTPKKLTTNLLKTKNHCLIKRSAVHHFEDLAKSLLDLKRFYLEGRERIEEINKCLLNEKININKQIKIARDIVPTKLDRDDMTYWLKQYKKGIDQQLKTLKQQLEHQNSVGIKYWASQLNLAKQVSKTSNYFEELRKKVCNQLTRTKTKRSNISEKNFINSIIKEFIRIVESEPYVGSLDNTLSKLTKNITLFKRSLSGSCIL
ncbi:uncharacterized protein LOC100211175 isoform X4 [Hydra vulgaris]|uniref:Uncharacterized protein LOC100211175 isoform X4 n=1 Tax=Hydra vulgaris TaxID=6087 RepID=A0ABM4CTC4_HYDVU